MSLQVYGTHFGKGQNSNSLPSLPCIAAGGIWGSRENLVSKKGLKLHKPMF
jgi:hypothetical protein